MLFLFLLLAGLSSRLAQGTCLNITGGGNCTAGCWSPDELLLDNGHQFCMAVEAGYYSPTHSNERIDCPAGHISAEPESDDINKDGKDEHGSKDKHGSDDIDKDKHGSNDKDGKVKHGIDDADKDDKQGATSMGSTTSTRTARTSMGVTSSMGATTRMARTSMGATARMGALTSTRTAKTSMGATTSMGVLLCCQGLYQNQSRESEQFMNAS